MTSTDVLKLQQPLPKTKINRKRLRSQGPLDPNQKSEQAFYLDRAGPYGVIHPVFWIDCISNIH
ncbi:hypothetical protein GCD22_02397 [Acidithiobacillus thiooxidans ATCC 19377]|uniref:Uncharacterized protein n=1 Tax=Acidithiobacillus thiooxidans ATCC 19377 TaxID=637390 RepID=A0A5P9XSA8_ACITH|nr:hypothetical protein GCD22_02397 [Acidithiobacillus thiooxidans ATCC 19377]